MITLCFIHALLSLFYFLILTGSSEEKSKLMFLMNDIDRKGYLSKEEFIRMLRFVMSSLLLFNRTNALFDSSSLPVCCPPGLLLKSLTAPCQRVRQMTASKP